MKTSLLRIGAIALLAAGTLGAQIHPSQLQNEANSSRAIPQQINTDMLPSTAGSEFIPGTASLKGGPYTQAVSWVNLWSTRFGPTWEVHNGQTIMVYDAGTNTLNLLRATAATNQGTGNLDGVLQVIQSTDGGANWAATEIFRRNGYLFLLPAFAIANPGTSNFADAFWTAFGYSYEWNGADYPFTGSVGLFKTTDDAFDFAMIGPDFNNPQGYTWNTGTLIGVNGDAPSIHHVSRLSNPAGVQFGAYGQWGFDPDFEDFTASSMPEQWDISVFVNPNDVASTRNGSPSLGADEEGRLYMVVNNIFADDDQNRVPAVSKSEDQGVTWSTFDRMPVSVFDAYRSQVGWANISVYGPYNREALAVTGVNQFSYFFRVAERNESDNVINLDLVEATYDNGAWTLTRVAELNGFPLEFNRATEPSEAIGPTAWLPEYSGARYGHEIHVAQTADGQSLLVQWIDDSPEQGWKTFDPPITVYFDQQGQWVNFPLDSMFTTDIYYSYRSINGGTWTAKTNITNDDAYDHGTRIPSVIPSLTSVPVMSLRPAPFSQYNPQYQLLPALQALPALIYDATVDNGTVSNIQFGTYNAANPNSVQDQQQPSYAFSLNAVAPNPAQNEAEVTFTMDVPGTVSLDLYSTTGSKIASVYNGYLSAGPHGLMLDASSIATGTYYVALTVNGQRLTQPIAIVK